MPNNACSAPGNGPVVTQHLSGGSTCLTLLVYHMISSGVANTTANASSRIRQVMPKKTNEAVLDE